MFNQFGRLADWIVDHRAATLLLIVVATILSGIGHYDPYLLLSEPTANVQSASAQKDDSVEPAKPPSNVAPIRVNAGDVIVVAQSDHFFTPDGAEAIRDAVAAVEALPQVRNVLWMDEAPMVNIFGLAERILPRQNATQCVFMKRRTRLLSIHWSSDNCFRLTPRQCC